MAYKALYRTYRPQIFSDVTGQEVVVKTLQNAIINNKISHAYLFSGPRGTGKTSVARIFAKALNCTDLVDGEPCDKCVSCQEISDGINPDVIEIDAASNNGVDEIRDIREKVKFLPSGSKYKIYIIDEVHMLSGGAFNALLKTLEEPPKHVVFILATTEPQKLPATIISRCQRFEFKALTVEEISERVKSICKLEDVTITEEALNSIGESAEGGMRDALSILDQAISYGNKEITIDDINEVTGSLSFEKIINLANAINKKDVHVTLEIVNELIGNGKEISKIINSLLVFYRDCLLYKSVGTSGFSKFVFTKEKFQELSLNIPMSKIMYFVDILSDIQNKVRYTTTPNVFLEIALIKMCNISVDELDIMKRVTELENKLNSLGDIEAITNQNPNSNTSNPADNEKINRLDAMVNQILSELNRLELPRQIDKINKLQESVNNSSNKTLESDLQHLRDKVEEIDLFVNKDGNEQGVPDEIYQRLEALENGKPLQTVQTESANLTPIKEKIVELENKLSNVKEQTNPVDLTEVYDRLNTLENSDKVVEKVVTTKENNVDLTEIYDRLNTLENTSKNEQNNTSNPVDLHAIYDRINVLETSVREEIETLSNNSDNQNNIDLISVYKRLDNLENNNDLIDKVNEKVSDIEKNYLDIMEDINDLKNSVNNFENNHDVPSGNVSEDLSEISDKLMFLERRVYQIMAGELANKKPAKKASKKNDGQIMLFGDDILSISNVDISNKEKFDFEDLEKSEEEIEQSKLNSKKEREQKELEEQANIFANNQLDEEENIDDIEEDREVDTESLENDTNKETIITEELEEHKELENISLDENKEETLKESNNSVFITGSYEVNKDLNNNVINSIINEEAKPTLFEKEKPQVQINNEEKIENETLFSNENEAANNTVKEVESKTSSLFDEVPVFNETKTIEPNLTNSLFNEEEINTETKKTSLFDDENISDASPIINDIKIQEENDIKPKENKEEVQPSLFDFEPVNNINNIDNIKEENSETIQHDGLFETANSIAKTEEVEKKTNNIVSEYYDPQANAQVINKERSSLVVREKQEVQKEYELEQDIIARESENVQVEEPVLEEKHDTFAKDKFASYDIKCIEQIMHDSRSMESRNDKVRIEQLWKVMTRGARPEYLAYMEILQEGKIAVVGNKEFIIVFPNVGLCNQVMRAKFKDIAIRILYNLLGDTYNYIALPVDVWTAKSIEYKQQYQIGIKYPTLKPLDIKGLEIISNAEEYKNEAEKAISQTIKMFGKDNINFE